MNIVIYNPNSIGGNYEYSKFLLKGYKERADVASVNLIFPVNTPDNETGICKILLADVSKSKTRIIRQLYFVYRSLINPFRLLKFLRHRADSVLIFNDYDQLTSILWVPFFRRLKARHIFAVVLHDPDRDKYLPIRALSEFTMKKLMTLIDVSLYHEYLPNKPYYEGTELKVNVPHGIYPKGKADSQFLQWLQGQKKATTVLGILGNIRGEKNYDLILNCLPALEDCQLLVAGLPSNSAVSVERYKEKIEDLGLSQRVIWVDKYLSDGEMHAAIEFCDVILMYYSGTFQSQSGILNMIAPYHKKLLVSDAKSALLNTAITYQFAVIAESDSERSFTESLLKLINMEPSMFIDGWINYIKAASWERHVDLAITAFKQVANK